LPTAIALDAVRASNDSFLLPLVNSLTAREKLSTASSKKVGTGSGQCLLHLLGSSPSTTQNSCSPTLHIRDLSFVHYFDSTSREKIDEIFFIQCITNRKEIDNANRLEKKLNLSPRDKPAITKEVFKRDFYRCRYCSLRIITSEVFSEYSRIVGSDIFSDERENTKRNGLTLGLRGVADHVEPYALGAGTELENLVTSCYSCNFGKAGYTLDQLRIEDPRLRQPKDDGWRGLTEYLPALKIIGQAN